ncbi:MAG: hypothetical protein KJ645_06435, partial [Planctomycetes bacterium]|nr:hypothetical protein [Planctomycetota bacterium]
MKRFLFFLSMFTMLAGLIAGIFYAAWPVMKKKLQPLLLNHMTQQLTDQERKEIYQEFAINYMGIWETVPDPNVARLGRCNLKKTVNKAEVN